MRLLRRHPGALGQALNVLIGLAIQAATAYLTLIFIGRILGAARFGGIAALYALMTSIATGLFQPLEQEVARRKGHERETGSPDRTLPRRVLRFGTYLSLVVVAIALILRDVSIHLLGDEPQLLAAFCVALPGYALCYISRGFLSGSRRLARYGLQLAVEGAFRLAGIGVLVLFGLRSVAAFGWLFAAAPWVALACSMPGVRPAPRSQEPRADRVPQPLVVPLILLLVSALAAQALIGAGPISARLFAGPGDQSRAGAFLAALVVVRLPIVLLTAVQPSMLPTMAAHTTAGRAGAFRSLLAKVLAAMGLIAFLTTLATSILGPWALKLLFGQDYVLSRAVFLLMGISVGLFMAASVLGQAVLTLGEHRSVAIGWLTGVTGMVLGTMLVGDPILKATMGLLVGAAAATVTFALLLWRALLRWQPTVDRSTGDGSSGDRPTGDRSAGDDDLETGAARGGRERLVGL